MRDNQEGGELDPADDVRRRCKKNSSVLSYIGEGTREGCDRGSEVGTVHSRRCGELNSGLPIAHRASQLLSDFYYEYNLLSFQPIRCTCLRSLSVKFLTNTVCH